MRELAEALVRTRRSGGRMTAGFPDLRSVEQGYVVQDLVQTLLCQRISGNLAVIRPPERRVLTSASANSLMAEQSVERAYRYAMLTGRRLPRP